MASVKSIHVILSDIAPGALGFLSTHEYKNPLAGFEIVRELSPSRNLVQSGPYLSSQSCIVIVKSFNSEGDMFSDATYCSDLFWMVLILGAVLLSSVFVQDMNEMKAITSMIQRMGSPIIELGLTGFRFKTSS